MLVDYLFEYPVGSTTSQMLAPEFNGIIPRHPTMSGPPS
jgi:hypothetical protein